MTLTEDDLRTLLHAPVEPAASIAVLDRVVAGRRRTSSPRRTWRIGMVTALAVVIVLGAVLAVVAVRPGGRATPQPQPQPPATPTVGAAPSELSADGQVVSFPDGSGFLVRSTTLYPGGQTVSVARDDIMTVVAAVQVTEPTTGSGRPALVPGRAPVDLGNGVTASWIYADVGAPIGSVGDSLTWRIRSGLTVTVVPSFDGATDDIVLALANAVQIGTPRAVRIPVSAGAWPAGWEVNSVSSSYVGLEGQTGTVGRDVRIEIRAPGTDQTAVTIEASGNVTVHAGEGAPVVIAGRTWGLIASADLFSWRGPGWSVAAMATYGAGTRRTVSDTQLQAFIADLSLASDFADESTWFDATDALGP